MGLTEETNFQYRPRDPHKVEDGPKNAEKPKRHQKREQLWFVTGLASERLSSGVRFPVGLGWCPAIKYNPPERGQTNGEEAKGVWAAGGCHTPPTWSRRDDSVDNSIVLS